MSGPLRTADLALATFLVCSGHQYIRMERNGDGERTCFWVFESTGDALRLMKAYQTKRASVEPNEFVRTWGAVRREMREFLSL